MQIEGNLKDLIWHAIEHVSVLYWLRWLSSHIWQIHVCVHNSTHTYIATHMGVLIYEYTETAIEEKPHMLNMHWVQNCTANAWFTFPRNITQLLLKTCHLSTNLKLSLCPKSKVKGHRFSQNEGRDTLSSESFSASTELQNACGNFKYLVLKFLFFIYWFF
jgi:hypothetical protein